MYCYNPWWNCLRLSGETQQGFGGLSPQVMNSNSGQGYWEHSDQQGEERDRWVGKKNFFSNKFVFQKNFFLKKFFFEKNFFEKNFFFKKNFF